MPRLFAVPAAPLCPSCDGPELVVTTEVRAEFHVYRDPAGQLAVRDARWGDAEWDPEAPATCRACAWRGTVGAARRHGRAAAG